MAPGLGLFDLTGKVALVTGAAGGLGFSTATALAKTVASVMPTPENVRIFRVKPDCDLCSRLLQVWSAIIRHNQAGELWVDLYAAGLIQA
jgi:NAD(P)-dependent dehydrogenase (short-subunit alcohol dehydrogenase family)